MGVDGAGRIRGNISRHSNALEGNIINNWRRYGMDRHGITVSDFLRNLADYLERPNLDIIHPSELPEIPKLRKASYNKLKKLVLADGKKMPPFKPNLRSKPKQKMTKALDALYEKYNLEPEYYG